MFHTQLANVLGAPVVGLVVRLIESLLFGLIDAPDVANDVAGQFAIRVIAKQPGLDVHARKAVTLGSKAGDFFVREAGAQGQ